MAATKKGLGRGLAALIPDDDMEFLSRVARGEDLITPPERPQQAPNGSATGLSSPRVDASVAPDEPILAPIAEGSAGTVSPTDRVVDWIGVDDIESNPFQPRRTFSATEMQELVDSVRDHGVLQPILVRPLAKSDQGKAYQLVAGERRWRAAREAGLETVPAVVREVADQQALELALIENVQRHDISPVDAAMAFRRLASEFNLAQDEIAKRVGKSRSAVANTLRLLDLPTEAQKAIDEGLLTEGHGRAILLANGDGARRAVFRHILREKLSVRAAEHVARHSAGASTGDHEGARKDAAANATAHGPVSPELQQVESELQKALGTRVKVRPKGAKSKSGHIVIEYFSDDDLNRVLQLLMPQRS
ncbi:MAG: ParB/RepB/Spo0J family partition protein [Burkholderiaceae bacterium]